MKKIIRRYKEWNPSIYATILILTMPFLVYFFIDFKLDNDFWFLINTGKTIIKEGFINTLPFTIHSGLYFVPQQWLIDIIFYFIYSNFDIYGMYLLVIVCNIIIIFLSYKLCYMVSDSPKKAIFITIFADVFLITSGIIATRPQLFDIIIFLLELFLIESYILKNNKKYLYPIPLLSLFLINAHASMWLMLFVFMVPYFFEYIISRYKKMDTFKIRPLLFAFAISIIIGFINPYGIHAIKYLSNSFGMEKINSLVNEMKPVDITEMLGLIVYIIIFIMLYSFYRNKGNNKIRYFLLSMGIIFLSLNHYKALLYLAILFPLIFGYNFKSDIKKSRIKVLIYEKILYVFLIIGVIFLVVTNVKLKEDVDIVEFADYLDKNANKDIRLFTDYNNGGYMEYRGYKCYIDPRAEVFLKSNNHKEDIFDEFYDLDKGNLDIKEFLNKYNFNYLLVDDNMKYLLKELQNNKNYKEVLSKVTHINSNSKTYLFENVEITDKK